MENRMDDELVVAGEALGPRVISVHPLPDYKLSLAFNNGERRVFDVKPLLSFPAFAPLKNEMLFHAVRVQFGTICWPGNIDYCPDTLYMQSVPE